MTTVKLYGELGKRFGKIHRLSIRNAKEAFQALRVNYPGFEEYVCNAHLGNIGFKVFVGASGLNEYSELNLPHSERNEIRIVPSIFGAATGWGKVLVGALLIAASIVAPLVPGAQGLSQPLFIAGAGLMLNGASQLMTKLPTAPSSKEIENNSSYLFNGPTNTTVQGRPVPIGFGRMIVGSVVISAGIESVQDSATSGGVSVIGE